MSCLNNSYATSSARLIARTSPTLAIITPQAAFKLLMAGVVPFDNGFALMVFMAMKSTCNFYALKVGNWGRKCGIGYGLGVGEDECSPLPCTLPLPTHLSSGSSCSIPPPPRPLIPYTRRTASIHNIRLSPTASQRVRIGSALRETVPYSAISPCMRTSLLQTALYREYLFIRT